MLGMCVQSPMNTGVEFPEKPGQIQGLDFLAPEVATLILKRLVRFWNGEEEVVKERLNDLTENDLDPYIESLKDEDAILAKHAADHLRDFIISKSIKEQHTQ